MADGAGAGARLPPGQVLRRRGQEAQRRLHLIASFPAIAIAMHARTYYTYIHLCMQMQHLAVLVELFN
uniref:Uncharacterized protein n=1 Tax=Arundo donax TaxID=35708 RepID=A0A0A9HBU0_ARUDO